MAFGENITTLLSDVASSPPGARPEDYRALGQSDSNIQVRDDGTLVINSIQKRDEGYYLCEADNQIGPTLSAVIYVNVQGKGGRVAIRGVIDG